jgi:hypothetical protein
MVAKQKEGLMENWIHRCAATGGNVRRAHGPTVVRRSAALKGRRCPISGNACRSGAVFDDFGDETTT